MASVAYIQGVRILPVTTLVLFVGLAPSLPAWAHSFGRITTLPVPLWLYQYGVAAALVTSFMVVAWVVSRPLIAWADARRDIRAYRAVRALTHPLTVRTLRGLAVACLVLAIVSGLLGARNPYQNFSMTAFWVAFVLGFFYLQALLGDLYRHLNPWRTLCEWAGHVAPRLFAGVVPAPQRFGHLPALLLYLGFIWFELYGGHTPFATAGFLLGYTAINLLGAMLWGLPAWFRYGEFFAVIFTLVSHLAPFESRDGRIRLRWPLAGLLSARVEGVSHLLIILFMLSSTAYDGLQATLPWLRTTWAILRDVLAESLAADPAGAYALLQSSFGVYQGAGLLVSPFVYLLAYAVALKVALLLSASREPLRDAMLRLGMALVPIAFVYHVAHYYTLLQVQGVKLLPLISDPLGRGWDLFGSAGWFQRTGVPDPMLVWNVQVGLILAGHVAGVFLAHLEEQRFRSGDGTRRIITAQLPVLLLMVAMTSFGLWVLAQPIAPSR